jgi:hypothetical protein
MKIEADSVMSFPRRLVFETQRDRMEAIAPYLKNIRSVHVKQRTDAGSTVELVNVWEGKGSKIPEAIAHIVSQDMLVWRDRAVWNAEDWTCRWEIESDFFEDAVRCAGVISYVAIDEGRTRVETKGDLRIDLKKKAPGLPAVLASPLGPLGRLVEQFMVRQITQNLLAVSPGLGRYLEERDRGV